MRTDERGGWDRRAWLSAAAVLSFSPRFASAQTQTKNQAPAQADKTKPRHEDEPTTEALPEQTRALLDAIEVQAKKAGLPSLDTSVEPPFAAIGDAPAPFRKEAMRICRDLSKVFVPLAQPPL